MQPLSNTDGSDSESDESSEIDASQQVASGKQYYKDLIRKANSVPLKAIFKMYSIKVDEHTKSSIICPFPAHKGKNYGSRESSPSFYYYPETDSFFCFGCKVGGKDIGKATMFVANMDNSNFANAAYKILDLFESDSQAFDQSNPYSGYMEKLELLMDFSNLIRDFMMDNSHDPLAISYAEKLTLVLDRLNEKHNLDITALRTALSMLTNKVKSYKSCPPF